MVCKKIMCTNGVKFMIEAVENTDPRRFRKKGRGYDMDIERDCSTDDVTNNPISLIVIFGCSFPNNYVKVTYSRAQSVLDEIKLYTSYTRP